MCLGQICEVLELGVEPSRAVVSRDGVSQSVSLMAMTEPVSPGDWVVVHSGFALSRLDRDEALAALALRSGTDPDHHHPEELP